ncbi:hypothetical protein M422DRAFT_41090 [Sphaerobolus stellatus SS14]|nr:hypothetical protein M422DRAFT_41090 [Sphaerobolus stellatus SS14]
MRLTLIIPLATLAFGAASPVVKTTSGTLTGTTTNGVNIFKGIFAIAGQSLIELLFNTPPPQAGESEDCLFLNVWAPVDTKTQTCIILETASIPAYDGRSIAQNQDIVVVTFNYRTNVFGFPEAEVLLSTAKNFGFLDQELALQWVQDSIAAFGGDKTKVTIQGESAGSQSVSNFLQRHPVNPPFRAAIMESGAVVSASTVPALTSFDAMAKAVGSSTIRTWTNGPNGVAFEPAIDGVTAFANPLRRIANHQTARAPILIGSNEDDGILFALGITDLQAFLNASFGPGVIPAPAVRALYPGQNDTQITADAIREIVFLCPAELTATVMVRAGQPHVFRYTYGPVFADLQKFPGAGAWHSSEIGEIFGALAQATASPAEATWSKTMQTIWTNFIKNPPAQPPLNWNRLVPGNTTLGLAKLAFNGNVELQNVVQAAPSNANDNPGDALFNQFLNF